MTEKRISERIKSILRMTSCFKKMPQQWVEFNVTEVEFSRPTVASCQHGQV